MIPGSYLLCRATLPDENTDVPDYQTLAYGYDTASQALADRAKVAAEAEVPEEDIVVLRLIAPEECSDFTT